MSNESSLRHSVWQSLSDRLIGMPGTVALGCLAVYQAVVSPWLGAHCRFVPSCSMYMAESIKRHGLVIGAWRGLRRLSRCHPFHRGGLDPVR